MSYKFVSYRQSSLFTLFIRPKRMEKTTFKFNASHPKTVEKWKSTPISYPKIRKKRWRKHGFFLSCIRLLFYLFVLYFRGCQWKKNKKLDGLSTLGLFALVLANFIDWDACENEWWSRAIIVCEFYWIVKTHTHTLTEEWMNNKLTTVVPYKCAKLSEYCAREREREKWS